MGTNESFKKELANIDQGEWDADVINRLGFYREIAGKGEIYRLVKTEEITQKEFNERIELAYYVGAPDVYDKLPPAKRLNIETRRKIDGWIEQAREDNRNRPLTDDEKDFIIDKINKEVAELCIEAKENVMIKYATGDDLIARRKAMKLKIQKKDHADKLKLEEE